MNRTSYNSVGIVNSSSSAMSAAGRLTKLNPEIDTGCNTSAHQPIDITYILIMMPFGAMAAITAMYIHYLVFRMSQRDKSLLNCLFPELSLTFLSTYPVYYISSYIVVLSPEPTAKVFGIWFCHVLSAARYVWIFKVWVFSLLVSILRYLYVVHNEKVTTHGLKCVERIFRFLYWAVPAGLAVVYLSLRTDHDIDPLSNQCYGRSPETSSSASLWYKIKQDICVYNDYGFTSHFAEYGLKILCAINVLATWLVFSNLAEAFFYYSIHIHLKA